jgi:hypothetical protein
MEQSTYMPSKYAKLKGLSPAMITLLKPKLTTQETGGRWFVVDCPDNDLVLAESRKRRTNPKRKY